jgi:vacuole morphology and inheritance protein 14
LNKEDVPTKMAALRWINMLMENRKVDMNEFTEELLPVLLRTLSDPSDAVILLDLQVLSRISLAQRDELGFVGATEEVQFQLVLNAILNLFAEDRQLLETRGSLIIRKLCVLLNAKSVYIRMADTLSSYEVVEDGKPPNLATLHFISTMVQTLNLILLTASELHDLRSILASSFVEYDEHDPSDAPDNESGNVFATLFHCWSHNPVATFSLCLLARAYDLSFALVKRFSDMEGITVGFLMQVDKLVRLLESPIFVHLRLRLLDVEAPYHAPLLKSIYGLLMCLPQGDAFRQLNERLTTVCNLRDNLGVSAVAINSHDLAPVVSSQGLDMDKLLERFDDVVERHREVKEYAQKIAMIQQSKAVNPDGSAGPSGTSSSLEGQTNSNPSVPGRSTLLPSRPPNEKNTAATRISGRSAGIVK